VNITIEQVVRPTLEELNGRATLGAAFEAHQRHSVAIEPKARFFVGLDGLAVGCGGVAVCDDYAEVKRMYTRPMAQGRGVAKALLRGIEDEARAEGMSVLRLNGNPTAGGDQSLPHGVSTARSVWRVGGNACPQHQDELVFREGAYVG
jgi:GNAT superfamily N-acetyltransferase